MLWASQRTLVWLHVMGPVLLSIGPGSPIPLVVCHILNHLNQALLHPVGREVLCA